VIAIIGDGDSRLRALQRLHYLRFSSEIDFLRKLEFLFVLGADQMMYANYPRVTSSTESKSSITTPNDPAVLSADDRLKHD
jgi:hypothetical protein